MGHQELLQFRSYSLPKKRGRTGHFKSDGLRLTRVFFGHFIVNSGAKKTQKNSLKLSTLEARLNFCSIFLGFYYLKHEKTRFPLKKLKFFAQKLSPLEARCLP